LELIDWIELTMVCQVVSMYTDCEGVKRKRALRNWRKWH